MSTLLPLLALALALGAALLSRTPNSSSEPDRGVSAGAIWAGGLALVILIASYAWKGWGQDASRAALGFLVGTAGAVVSRWLPAPSRLTASLALAAACEGFLLWSPVEWRLLAQLGMIVGAAFAAWILSVRAPSSISSAAFPLSAGAIMAADFLGSKAVSGDAFTWSGTLLAVAAVAAGVLGLLLPPRSAAFRQAVSIAVLVVAVLIIGQRYLGVRDAWVLTLAGVGIGLTINWLLDDNEADSLKPLIAAVMWIGLATLGFALRRGYGMSLGLLGGATTLLLLGNVRALLTLGPLAGLVMYRVFREEHVEATRALDIGQHYTLIGFTVGALIPLLPADWYRGRATLAGTRVSASALLWILFIAFVPAVIGLLMGPKGVVGLVAGLGFAGIIESVRYRASLQPLGLALGIGALTTLLYQFMDINTTMSRDEKVAALVPLSVLIGILVVVLSIVSPRAALKEAEAQ